MKLSERLRQWMDPTGNSKKLLTQAREAADMLDECESVIGAMRQEIQNLGGSLEGLITADELLARLRAQERG